MAGDIYWSNVVLLLHADGTNNSTTFTDSSSYNQNLLSGNSAALTTTTAEFGTASLNFPANNSNITNVAANNPLYNFGTGQFTVECWINNSRAGPTVPTIMGLWGAFSQQSWRFTYDTSGHQLHFQDSTDGTSITTDTHGAFTLASNTWTSVAADRDATNTLRIYANGSIIASATVTDNFKAAGTGIAAFIIGNDSGSGNGWIGQIDEVRITTGIARYAGAYTPSSTAFPVGPYVATGSPMIHTIV